MYFGLQLRRRCDLVPQERVDRADAGMDGGSGKIPCPGSDARQAALDSCDVIFNSLVLRREEIGGIARKGGRSLRCAERLRRQPKAYQLVAGDAQAIGLRRV